MKKLSILLLMALFGVTLHVSAQTINNPNFEQLNTDGSVSYWGNVYLFSVTIDSMGNSMTDSIVFDGQYFYWPTTDAYSGNHALELRNAWNYTTNTGIVGAAGVDDDTTFMSWGLANAIPTPGTAFNPFAPFNYSFWYKFDPVNGDSAAATISFYDSLSNVVGTGTYIITSPAAVYTQAIVPVAYNSAAYPAFYSMSFHNFYSADPGSHQCSFGTRLLVDHIQFNVVSAGMGHHQEAAEGMLFPNPASEWFQFRNDCETDSKYTISNLAGQDMLTGQLRPGDNRIAVETLEPGIYLFRVNGNASSDSQKLVIAPVR